MGNPEQLSRFAGCIVLLDTPIELPPSNLHTSSAEILEKFTPIGHVLRGRKRSLYSHGKRQ